MKNIFILVDKYIFKLVIKYFLINIKIETVNNYFNYFIKKYFYIL